jgi:hypothetical protein
MADLLYLGLLLVLFLVALGLVVLCDHLRSPEG